MISLWTNYNLHQQLGEVTRTNENPLSTNGPHYNSSHLNKNSLKSLEVTANSQRAYSKSIQLIRTRWKLNENPLQSHNENKISTNFGSLEAAVNSPETYNALIRTLQRRIELMASIGGWRSIVKTAWINCPSKLLWLLSAPLHFTCCVRLTLVYVHMHLCMYIEKRRGGERESERKS